jgi:hypothetical protein
MPYESRITGRSIGPRGRLVRSVDGIPRTPQEEDELNLMAARVFSSGVGREFLDHLMNTYFAQVSEASIPTEQLRHIEGQRWLIGVIAARVSLGQTRGPREHVTFDGGPDDNQAVPVG